MAVTVRVLIWGDLQRERLSLNRAQHSNVLRAVAEVSSGRSSGECWITFKTKDQRNRTRQHLVVLVPRAACCPAGSKERRMTSGHALEHHLLEQIVTRDNLMRACDRQGWRKVEQRRSSCREARESKQGCGRCGRDYSSGFSDLGA